MGGQVRVCGVFAVSGLFGVFGVFGVFDGFVSPAAESAEERTNILSQICLCLSCPPLCFLRTVSTLVSLPFFTHSHPLHTPLTLSNTTNSPSTPMRTNRYEQLVETMQYERKELDKLIEENADFRELIAAAKAIRAPGGEISQVKNTQFALPLCCVFVEIFLVAFDACGGGGDA